MSPASKDTNANVSRRARAVVQAWVQRMEKLPYHEEAHQALTSLGNLAVPNEVSMPKRLGAATKVGMEAYKKVQASYTLQKL